ADVIAPTSMDPDHRHVQGVIGVPLARRCGCSERAMSLADARPGGGESGRLQELTTIDRSHESVLHKGAVGAGLAGTCNPSSTVNARSTAKFATATAWQGLEGCVSIQRFAIA